MALKPPPQWSFSGVWAPERGELLLVDVVKSALLRYSPDGSLLATVPQPAGERGTDHLTEAHPLSSGGFLLQEGPTGLLQLDEDLGLVRRFDLRGELVRWSGGQGSIGGLSHFTPIGEEVAALAPLQSKTGVIYAVVRVDLPSGELLPGHPLPAFRGEEEEFASTTAPLMASAGGEAFLLALLEGSLGIHRLEPEVRRLSAFPDGYSTPPKLPQSRGPDSTVSTFAFVEGARMPTGLYGRGEHLFLLTREPGATGTLWRLHQIDPEADRLVRSLLLPTTANHLFVVPGSRQWALVEKGPVAGPGQQAIPSAVLVPAAWIEDPASRVLTGDKPPACESRRAHSGGP